MRTFAIAAAAALAAGCQSSTCSDQFFGQDCGPQLDVTMVYVLDGGALPDNSACGPAQICHVNVMMTAAQYYYAVVPAYPDCFPVEISARSRAIDCAYDGPPDNGCRFRANACTCPPRPVGAFGGECEWVPPLLHSD